MALQKSTTTTQAFVCPEAYVVIEKCLYRKDRGEITCSVSIYKNVASRDSGKPALSSKRTTCSYDLEGPNMITQGYNALKLETDMAEAIDV